MGHEIIGDNSSDCGGSGRADPFFRQCPSALTKLTQVNATESPLAQAFLDAGSVLKHPVKNLNRWRIGQSSAAFMAAQNAIYRGLIQLLKTHSAIQMD